MSPDASPWSVRRFNNGPVFIVLGIATAFVSVLGFVAAGRANQSQAATPKELPHQRADDLAARLARSVVGNRKTGVITPSAKTRPAPPTLPPPLQPGVVVPVVTVTDDQTPPLPPSRLNTPQGPTASIDDEERKARLAVLARALAAPTNVEIQAQHATAAATSQDPIAAERDRVQREIARLSTSSESGASSIAVQRALQAAQAAPGGATPPGSAEYGGAQPARANDIGAFDRRPGEDRFRLESRLEPPRSEYVAQAGTVIPATLISGVNSELAGPIIAQVAQTVYDTPTGRYALIPQGSKLYGLYSSGVAFGQGRLLIAWQRIGFPDGRTIDIGAMPGTDGIGRAGFEDQVDNHYFRIFASAILLSGVVAGITLSQESGSQGQTRVTAGSAMSQALGQELGQVTAQFIAKNMNIAPTLEIRPGYRFNVVATKDIEFPGPYRRQL